MVNILIVSRNSPEHLRDCVVEIGKYYGTDKVRLIIVDDGSTDPKALKVLDELEKSNHKLVLRNKRKEGLIKSLNRGLLHIDDDVLILSGKDYFKEGIIEVFEGLAYCNNEKEVVSIAILDKDDGYSDPIIEYYDNEKQYEGLTLYEEIKSYRGFCMYIKKSHIDEVNGFAEDPYEYGFFYEVKKILAEVIKKIAKNPIWLLLLIIGGYFIGMEIGIFYAILLLLLFSWIIYDFDSRIIAFLALVQLCLVPIFLILKQDMLAEKYAQQTYFFLVLTVFLQIVEQIRYKNLLNKTKKNKVAKLCEIGILSAEKPQRNKRDFL